MSWSSSAHPHRNTRRAAAPPLRSAAAPGEATRGDALVNHSGVERLQLLDKLVLSKELLQ